MKKMFTKLLTLTAILVFTTWSVNAQTGSTLLDTNFEDWKPTIGTDQANGTYDIPNASLTIYNARFNNKSTPNAGTNTMYPNYFRLGTSGNYIEITPTEDFVGGGRVTIIISTNATASATNAFSIKDSEGNTYTEINMIGKTHTPVSVDLPATFTGKQTIRLERTGTTTFLHAVKIETNVSGPTISLTSGTNPADGMQTVAIDPIVLTYKNVADDANATFDWYTDNTYTATTTAPAGLSVAKDLTAKTFTVSGIPTTAGTFYYKAIINEAGGNSIEGSIVVSPYTTPAPVFGTAPDASTQTVKAGSAISNIEFTLTDALSATVTGLPMGLTGTYTGGIVTISGIVDASAALQSYSYTVTATPLIGYAGSEVTATGTITVIDANAKNILYLSTSSTLANDNFLADIDTKYSVTVRPAQANFSGNYDAYDLIVLHESLTGGDAATATHELALIKSVDKPILNNKSYFYTTSGTARWAWGTASNGDASKCIYPTEFTHPIFNGVTLVGDSIEIYNDYKAKNIQPTSIEVGGFEVGKVAGGVAIHDLPAAVRLTSGTSKYLLVSLLNGEYTNLTPTAILLLNNAVEYLLNGTQFSPLVNSLTVDKTNNIYFDGQVVRNANAQALQVYNTVGVLVATSNHDINMSSYSKGIYIVKSAQGSVKIALK